jgi:hypothetical protein
VNARDQRDPVPTYRLRRLQHLLIDLIKILDEEAEGEGRTRRGYVDAAPACRCDGCSVESEPQLTAQALPT